MSWIFLLIASVFEIGWVVAIKAFSGAFDAFKIAIVLALLLTSVGALSLAMRTIPMGTAYAIWTGIGVVGAVVIGVIEFGEPISLMRMSCIALILAGAIGLRLSGTGG